MKKTLLSLFLFLPFLALATKYSGMDTVEHWSPGRGQNGAMIKNLVIKWELDDYGGTSVVKSAAIKWELGEYYVLNGKKYAVSGIKPEAINQLTINGLTIRMNVLGRSESVAFDCGNFPKAGAGMGKPFQQTVAWDKVFIGVAADEAKKIFQTGVKLTDASFLTVSWGGTFMVEQALTNPNTGGTEQPFPSNPSSGGISSASTSQNTKTVEEILKNADDALVKRDYAGAEKICRDGLVLYPKNPQISNKINQIKYAQCMELGDKALANKNFSEAIKQYETALGYKPNDAVAMQKIEQAKSGNAQNDFDALVKEGDAAFYQKNYNLALQKYRAALQIKPNEPSVLKKVSDTELAQKKDNYVDLMQDGDRLAQQRNFNGAMQKYQQARGIFNDYELAQLFPNMPTPSVKMQAIELEIARMNYAAAMENGDRAFNARDYRAAVTHYRNALSIFPNDVPAANKLKDAEHQIELGIKFEQTTRELKLKYEDKRNEADTKSKTFLNQAIHSFAEEIENCNIMHYQYQIAYKKYYEEKMNVATDEAAYMIYGDLQAKQRANVSVPSMIEPACNQFDSKSVTDNADARTYVEVAKRKYELANKLKVEGFATFAKEITEDALKMDAKLAEAWAFMANFSTSTLGKMKNIQKALSLEPSNVLAKSLQSKYAGGFAREISESITQGKTAYIEELLEDAELWQGLNLDYNGKSPFRTAIETDKDGLLFGMLNRKLAKTIQDSEQNLLFFAVEQNAGKCIKVLLNKGAKCDMQNSAGQTPLALATKKGANNAVAALTANCGGNLDTGNALQTAVENNQVEIAKTLLKAGANPDKTDLKGETLLMLAIGKKADAMVKALLDAGANVNVENYAKESPLMVAAAVESYPIIAQLLDKGADEKAALARLNERPTAAGLYLTEKVAEYGIEHFKPDMVATAQGYNPQLAAAKANNGQALMLYAIEKGSFQAAKVLVDSDVNFNESFSGKSILMEAIARDLVEVVRALLQQGKASLEIRNEKNETPLHIAARNGKLPMIELLVYHHHSLEVKDGKGNTPLMTAIEADKSEAAGAMVGMGFDLNTSNLRSLQPIHLATILKDGYVVELLLNKGVNVNAKGEDNMTALHFAAKNGDTDLAKFLLSKGADKKAKDKFKRTASKVAKQGKFKDLAKMLK